MERRMQVSGCIAAVFERLRPAFSLFLRGFFDPASSRPVFSDSQRISCVNLIRRGTVTSVNKSLYFQLPSTPDMASMTFECRPLQDGATSGSTASGCKFRRRWIQQAKSASCG
jgi:hypothetical protein